MGYIFKGVIYYLLFPGFATAAVLGLLSCWFDRKLTARFQWRVGPPWYQPFLDIIKLFGKETIIPSGANTSMFIAAPYIGLVSVIIVSMLLSIVNLSGQGFLGDIIVVVYLLTLLPVSAMMGGFSSRNPLASIGASREMKLVLAYELPFILAIASVIIKTQGAIDLDRIIDFQSENCYFIWTASGFIAFIVSLLCVQAKLGFTPFDMADAEQEIMAGAQIEYSGVLLAVIKLSRAILLFTLNIFLITLFMGGIDLYGVHIVWSILKYLSILFLMVVIKNTNPRVRIDHAVRFFWGPVTLLAVLSVILALIGK